VSLTALAFDVSYERLLEEAELELSSQHATHCHVERVSRDETPVDRVEQRLGVAVAARELDVHPGLERLHRSVLSGRPRSDGIPRDV